MVDPKAIDAPVAIDAPADAAIVIPAFRNPVVMADLDLARAAATKLGIHSGASCDQCHAVTRGTLNRWLTETRAGDACLANLVPATPAEAKAVLDCFQGKPGA